MRQIPCPEAMAAVLKNPKIMKNDRKWTHIQRLRLRIKRFESQRCYLSNGTTADPQNSHRKFKIDQKIPRPNRPNCPLNLAINHPTLQLVTCLLLFSTNYLSAYLTTAHFTRLLGLSSEDWLFTRLLALRLTE